MNVFTCYTRLYKDAEHRFTQGGESIVSFTGAVDSGYGKNKATTWIKFNLWGKRGESLFPYLKDKSQVIVSGELTNREWNDKEGNKRHSLEVRVNELTLTGGKPEAAESKEKPSFESSGDDIPF